MTIIRTRFSFHFLNTFFFLIHSNFNRNNSKRFFNLSPLLMRLVPFGDYNSLQFTNYIIPKRDKECIKWRVCGMGWCELDWDWVGEGEAWFFVIFRGYTWIIFKKYLIFENYRLDFSKIEVYGYVWPQIITQKIMQKLQLILINFCCPSSCSTKFRSYQNQIPYHPIHLPLQKCHKKSSHVKRSIKNPFLLI